MDRHKSTISQELARNTGLKGYSPRQACLLAEERSLGSRNAVQINPKDWDIAVTCLHHKWSPEQIADQLGISHETIYRHVYADKAAGGSLCQQLRCQKSVRNAMPVAAIAEAKSSAEDPLVSAQRTLKLELKSVTGKAIP
jgi:IS30 family transposase